MTHATTTGLQVRIIGKEDCLMHCEAEDGRKFWMNIKYLTQL